MVSKVVRSKVGSRVGSHRWHAALATLVRASMIFAVLVLLVAPGAWASDAGPGGPPEADAGVTPDASAGGLIIQLPPDDQAPKVNASASPTVLRLGTKFTLFINATFGAGVEVNLREPLDLGPAFEITRKLSEDGVTRDGLKTREWQLEVIVWELGELMLPPIAVTYTASGTADQVMTNRVKLRVDGALGEVLDDPKAVRGASAPIELMIRDWFWLYVALGGVGLIVAALVVRWLVRRRRKPRLEPVVVLAPRKRARPKQLDTPSDRAMSKLAAIEQSGVLDHDETRRDGYAEMVEVIREYLGSRYRVATFDLTTTELLAKLAPVAPVDEHAQIEAWLGQCDIVKYGGFRPGAGDAHHTLEDARALVIATTTRDQPIATRPPSATEAPPSNPDPSVLDPQVDEEVR